MRFSSSHRPAALLAAVSAFALAGCGAEEAERATPDPVQEGQQTGHVHAVAVDPSDESIVVAAHSGLFRAVPGAERATATGDGRDAMGFTVQGPGRYVASGHPAPGSDEPQSVGLIRSTDAGRTWEPVSLAGEADLHVLEVADGGRVYGFDALSGQFLSSRDDGRTWERSAVPPVLDIGVDPTDPDTLVASTEDGLLRSADGGRRWRPAAAMPPGQVVWTDDGLLVLGLDGAVRRISRLGQPPQTIGELPGPVSAATEHEGELLAAQDDGSVLSSSDGGRSWQPRLAPAA